jgi:hypothetical protein
VIALVESLNVQIARMEPKHGSDNPYVKDLKEQLRASEETSDKTAQEVYQMLTVQFALVATEVTETEQDGIRAETLRRLQVRRLFTKSDPSYRLKSFEGTQ